MHEQVFQEIKKLYQTQTEDLVHTNQLLRPLSTSVLAFQLIVAVFVYFLSCRLVSYVWRGPAAPPRRGAGPAAPSAAAHGLEPAMWRHTAALEKFPCPLQLELQNDSDLGISPFFTSSFA